MKAKLKYLNQDIEVEGTPEEISAFVKALQTVQLAPLQTKTTVSVYVCPNGGYHEYPAYWLSVSPLACTKCGQSDPSWQLTPWSGPWFQANPQQDLSTQIAPNSQEVRLDVPLSGLPEPRGCTD